MTGKNNYLSVKDLISLAERLPEPADYWKGFGNLLPELPANIIFLQRNSRHTINVRPKLDTLLHHRYVLTLNFRQEGLACVSDKTYYIPENYACLVYPFCGHHYIVDQDKFFWLVITFELVGQYMPNLMFSSFEISPFACSLTAQMLDIYLTPNPQEREKREALLQSLLYSLLFELKTGNSAGEERGSAEKLLPQQYKIDLFDKINNHICEHLTDPELSVKQLTGKYGMSLTSLYSLFRLLVGVNPGEYIRTLRLKRALRLMAGNDMLLSDVAEQSGFSSSAIFSRCFSQFAGMSPREYIRKKLSQS